MLGWGGDSPPQVPGARCAAPEADAWVASRFPQRPSRAAFERWLAQRRAVSSLRSDTVITLPVIVHILHDGEAPGQGTNLSAAQVASQLTVLNEDFRRLAGTPGHNTHPAGADVRVEFCPVSVDPSGQFLAEPGIHRVNRQTLGLGPPPYARPLVQASILPATIWDPDQYLNLWVIDLAGDLLGFAQSPDASTLPDLNPANGPAQTDGVVVSSRAFGRGGSAQAPFDQGRTTTHEVGHWLGLWHIWGDGDCSQDDYCSDTPTADAPTYHCPPAGTACGGTTMVDNYMDYTDDACMRLFTQCQKERMRTVLTHAARRASLAHSTACQGSAPPVAGFTVSQRRLCAGGTVQFRDASLGNPAHWAWTFAGGVPATAQGPAPQVRYDAPGRFAVTLTVRRNGDSSQLVRPAFIEVGQAGTQEIFAEDFTQDLGAWRVENPDQATGWQWTAVGGSRAGEGAATIGLYFYPAQGARDRLISPVLDLTGFATAQLAWDHAYRAYAGAQDSLLVWASADSGQQFYRLYAAAENGQGSLATGPPVPGTFIPDTAPDWCYAGSGWATCPQVGLPSTVLQPGFAFTFETVNDFGNNVYLDRIRLTGTCAWTTALATLQPSPADSLILWPNPARDLLFLRLPAALPGPLVAELFDLHGRFCTGFRGEVHHTGEDVRWAIGRWPAGLYLVRVRQGSHSATRRILLY